MSDRNAKPSWRPALHDASHRANESPARQLPGSARGPVEKTVCAFAEFIRLIGRMPTIAERQGYPEPGWTYTHAQLVALAQAFPNGPRTQAPAPPPAPMSTSGRAGGEEGEGEKYKAWRSLKKDIAEYKQNLNKTYDPGMFKGEIRPSCATIRTKINKLFDSGIMKKGEFARAIGVDPKSLQTFMKGSGPTGGTSSHSYSGAFIWFRQREVAGIEMPDVEQRRKLVDAEADAAEADAEADAADAAAAAASNLPDISGIRLPGEEDDAVPCFDSCDEIRLKINAHLRTPGRSTTRFCREIFGQLNKSECKGISMAMFARFRGASGSRAGCMSFVYYAAYVYFEKLRIAGNQPKTAHRQEMERLWPSGMPRASGNRWITYDQYGKRVRFD